MRIMLLGGIIEAIGVLRWGKNTSIEKVSTDISSSVYPFLCKLREKQQQERRLNRIEEARKKRLDLTRSPPSAYYSKEGSSKKIMPVLKSTESIPVLTSTEFVEIQL